MAELEFEQHQNILMAKQLREGQSLDGRSKALYQAVMIPEICELWAGVFCKCKDVSVTLIN